MFFDHQVYKQFGLALLRLRKLDVNLLNEAKMIDVLIEEVKKKCQTVCGAKRTFTKCC